MSWKTWNHIPDHSQEVSEEHQLEKLLLFQEEMCVLLFLHGRLLPPEQFFSIVKSTVVKKAMRKG